MAPAPRQLAMLFAIAGSGCGGVQSALNPAGEPAEETARLFWWMTAFGTLVWIAMIALAWYAVRAPKAQCARLKRIAMRNWANGRGVPNR